MVRQAKAADFEADPRVCDSEYLRNLSIARRNQGKQWVWVAASREEAQQPRDLPNEAYLTGSQAVGDPNKSLGMSMEMWAELARAGNQAGDEIILRRRGDIYEIRYNGWELMSNFNHRSEVLLAERSLRLLGRPAKRVLIGGLGMGFTLGAALEYLGPDAKVTVCELIPEIVGWHDEHLGQLAGHPLRDRRVEIYLGDVMDVLRDRHATYDLILMDTDNGPDSTVRDANNQIYGHDGLGAVERSLKPDGIASFWSATISPKFETNLNARSRAWRRDDVLLAGGRADAFHYIYFLGPGRQAAADSHERFGSRSLETAISF